jgi:hypothetical protein
MVTKSKEALINEEYLIFKKVLKHKARLSEAGPPRKQEAFRKFTRFQARVLAAAPELEGYHPRRYSRKWLTAAAQLVSGKISAPTAKPKAKPKAKK